VTSVDQLYGCYLNSIENLLCILFRVAPRSGLFVLMFHCGRMSSELHFEFLLLGTYSSSPEFFLSGVEWLV
jgi:hypothetical protein